MIKICRRLRFAAKTHQRFVRIGVMRQNSFQRDDTSRVSLAGTINNSHPAMADFFKNLIIAQSPVGIAHIDRSE
jgi:hypothetical protein